MDNYQCQECQGYFRAEDTEQPILCTGCLDKLAGFDLADLDRKYLIGILRELRKLFNKAETDEQKWQAVAVAQGMIPAALNHVGEKE